MSDFESGVRESLRTDGFADLAEAPDQSFLDIYACMMAERLREAHLKAVEALTITHLEELMHVASFHMIHGEEQDAFITASTVPNGLQVWRAKRHVAESGPLN